MSSKILSHLMEKLSKPTSFFGIKLWILIALAVSFIGFTTITVLFLCCTLCRRKKPYKPNPNHRQNCRASSLGHSQLLSYNNASDTATNGNKNAVLPGQVVSPRTSSTSAHRIIDVESTRASTHSAAVIKDSWRKMFSLLEIEVATNELGKENVIGHGDYGTVYHGVLSDGTRVAVKKLLINSCEAEEFVVQAEEIGHVRHKNLVNLLGYCIEGSQRMLVYEYVDNKSVHHWLHQCTDQQLSPLAWTTRMDIIYGIAKGLEYLHEGIEPKILHGSLKSSNVMLDNQLNPKLTDFGIAKLFSPQWGFILMEALGYVAPENDHKSPYNFNEKHDVYSFGVLTMEIITGRAPIDRHRSQPYLIDWLKSMVASGNIANVVDPNLPQQPCLKDLKRIVLIALRCVDPDEEHRPSIGDITLMFEPQDLLIGDDELHFLSSI